MRRAVLEQRQKAIRRQAQHDALPKPVRDLNNILADVGTAMAMARDGIRTEADVRRALGVGPMMQEAADAWVPSKLADDHAQMLAQIAERKAELGAKFNGFLCEPALTQTALLAEIRRLRDHLRWIAPRDPDARRALDGHPAPKGI